jgi:hypothetical protein
MIKLPKAGMLISSLSSSTSFLGLTKKNQNHKGISAQVVLKVGYKDCSVSRSPKWIPFLPRAFLIPDYVPSEQSETKALEAAIEPYACGWRDPARPLARGLA